MVMEFLGARVQLNPRPARQTPAALEVAMLGHCPGRVRIERLLPLSDALDEIRQLGFGARLRELETAMDLYHLPIPLRSIAEFDDIFPEARRQATSYRSVLAGDKAWLPQAVEDFFANGGEKCWIVQVPEVDGVHGFLPRFDVPLHDVDNLQGLASVLVLNDVGLIALPDLERIQIPAQLPDIPRKRLPNPDPQFVPCGSSLDDDHRERRGSDELINEQTPLAFIELLRQMLAFIGKHRPDVQCLYSMPLAYSEALDSPAIDRDAVESLETARHASGAYLLRQVQLLFPYLRDSQSALRSAVGVIAGTIANSARRRGIWRSIAGLTLSSTAQPYPYVPTVQAIALRESPGIGVLRWRNAKLAIDDERITVPALHRNDYEAGVFSERLNSMRAGEVVRFMGFLLRQLRALGERMIFNVSPSDPRPRLILEKFFIGLHRDGALRGSVPEQAFRIRQFNPGEAAVGFDIEVAPAFPIDKIVLTFVNRDGQFSVVPANSGVRAANG